MTLALVGSPLLGAAAWQPVADLLGAVVVTPRGDSATEVLDSLLTALPADDDLVLVPHSNAGLYVGAVSLRRPVRAAVFVDAGIPDPDGSTPTAPEQVLGLLTGLADEQGRLPPWTQWWAEQDVAPLFPDAATRAQVETAQPRLPLSYFSDSVPAAPGWEEIPCGYVAFGETYAEEINRAERSGWPVRRLDGRHLHMLVEPQVVAEQIRSVLAELAV